MILHDVAGLDEPFNSIREAEGQQVSISARVLARLWMDV